MAKAKVISITRQQFSIMMELLLEKCYGETVTDIKNWSGVKLYGYNNSAGPHSIKQRARLSRDGRVLKNAVDAYHRKELSSLSQQLVNECLSFVGYPDLEQMESIFLEGKKKGEYQAPPYLKYLSSSINEGEIQDRVKNIQNTEWVCYSHLPSQTTEDNQKKVLRFGLKFTHRLGNGDCEVMMENAKPYTSFSGRLIKKYSEGNVLTCELTSLDKVRKKRLYLLIHVSSDASKDLYAGLFLRHTDSGNIYAGSMILRKLPKGAADSVTGVTRHLDFVREADAELENAIRDFLFDQALNHLKIPPSIFSEEDLFKWIKKKDIKESRRMPVYDLYVTAPFKGFQHRYDEYDALGRQLLVELGFSAADTEEQPIRQKIEEFFLRKREVLDNKGKVMSYQNMTEQIKDMIVLLKGEDIGFKNIWFAQGEATFSPGGKLDSGTVLMRQLSRFNQSKRMLFILPYPLLTSAFIELGWSINRSNYPVFIVAHRNDLPFLLRKADTLKNRYIYIKSWDELGSIENIPAWIKSNEYHLI